MSDFPPREARSDSRLTIQTLGGWALSYASPAQALTPVFGPSKPLAMLVYMALSPNRPAAREHLIDMLWADVDPDSAGHALRQTVWYIRQRAGADILKATGGMLTLTAPVDVDRDAFLAAIEAHQLERALELYRGDFLPGFAAPGGA